jgi:hypothetical protein
MVHFCDKIDRALVAYLMFLVITGTQDLTSLAREMLQIG